MTEISPAILTNDISDFRQKYAELFALSHYFKTLHVDFADGKFVENKTIMPHDLHFLKTSPLTLVAHFMTYYPQKYFWDAKKSGFKIVLIQYEAMRNDVEALHCIEHGRSMGLKVGLVINPETPLHKIAKFITKVDAVQLMGIHPGAQGREFMPETIAKAKELRALSKNVIISVDGGVKVGIAHKLAEAGANILVAGSAIVHSANPQKALQDLQTDIEI